VRAADPVGHEARLHNAMAIVIAGEAFDGGANLLEVRFETFIGFWLSMVCKVSRHQDQIERRCMLSYMI
ncbi:MAG: hypothetical protein WAN46_06270, partial [Gammaproteobacteria bacterium]